jgi:hypothetical protein
VCRCGRDHSDSHHGSCSKTELPRADALNVHVCSFLLKASTLADCRAYYASSNASGSSDFRHKNAEPNRRLDPYLGHETQRRLRDAT